MSRNITKTTTCVTSRDDAKSDTDDEALSLFRDLNMVLDQMRDAAGNTEGNTHVLDQQMVTEEVFHHELESSAVEYPEHMEQQTSSYQPKTSSVAFNVYGDANSRSNSVDYHCTLHIFRRSSIDTTGLQCFDTSSLTRIPLESTPLVSAH